MKTPDEQSITFPRGFLGELDFSQKRLNWAWMGCPNLNFQIAAASSL
jgi:hypothetical protein